MGETESNAAVPAREPPTVRCDALEHEYGGSDGTRSWFGSLAGSASPSRTVTALDDVSLEIRSGDIVGLAGPSGSGKSTLLHAIAGLLVPTRGAVELCGRDLTELSARARTRLRHDHVGLVFQRFHLLPSLSARSNVAVPLVQSGVGRRERRRRASALLERVGLADRETHRPGALSGGERQRVAIARALVTDPTVVVADEPTGELDTETGREVLDLLTDVADDRTVVMASHDADALAVTDRVVELRDGAIVERGSRDGTVIDGGG